MEDGGDFTFPTVAATAATGGRCGVDGPVALSGPGAAQFCDLLPLAGFAAPGGASSPLWPFSAPSVGTASAPPVEEGEAPASRIEEAEQQRVAAEDEERMDLLWEGGTTATAPALASTRSGGGRAGLPEADERAANQEKMDLLWESFNEELLLLRRARSKAAAAAADHRGGLAQGLDPDWYLFHSPSDAESEETSSETSPGRPRYGCAPTMLRASSRAGGAGQFCSSPRRRSRSRSRGGWALLLSLFRRLFAVDKAPARRHSIYVP